jgi:hypothetical protein
MRLALAKEFLPQKVTKRLTHLPSIFRAPIGALRVSIAKEFL